MRCLVDHLQVHRADRGDEVGRRERVKRAQEAKAKRSAVKDTPIDKYKPSPAMGDI